MRREVLEAVGGLRLGLCGNCSYAAGILGWVSDSGGFLPMQHRATGRGISGFATEGGSLCMIISTLRRCLKERSDVC